MVIGAVSVESPQVTLTLPLPGLVFCPINQVQVIRPFSSEVRFSNPFAVLVVPLGTL